MNNQRITKQKIAILEELSKVKTHPTASEIYDMVKKRIPNISLGTVYRNLEQLSESGVIQKLELPGKQKRFDGTIENHYHFRCIACDRVDDIEMSPIHTIDEIIAERCKCKVLRHRLEFLGLCTECCQRISIATL